MSLSVSINGTTLLSQNILPFGSFDPWKSSLEATADVAMNPGFTRGYISDTDDIAPRTIVMPLAVNTFSSAAMIAAEDWIKGFVRRTVTLTFDDGTTSRELVAKVRWVPLQPKMYLSNTLLIGNLTAVAPDPNWRATSDTVLGSIGGSPASITLGSGEVEDWSLSVTVSGGADPRTLTVAIAGATLIYTGTIGANAVVFNADTCQVTNNAVDDTANSAGGFPVLLPWASPTVAVASSSGTPTGVLTYRKRYR